MLYCDDNTHKSNNEKDRQTIINKCEVTTTHKISKFKKSVSI